MALPVSQRNGPRRRAWQLPGFFCALASVIFAALGFLMQVSSRSITGIVELLFSVLVCLIAVVALALWVKRVFHSIGSPEQAQQAASPVAVSYPLALQGQPVAPVSPAFSPSPARPSMPVRSEQAATQVYHAGPLPLFPMPVHEMVAPGSPFLPPPPSVPIEKVLLLEFDDPGNGERPFILQKESEPLIECQDRYALDSGRRCYAVADGVSNSFIPGPWARIIARGFVEQPRVFEQKEVFQQWLSNAAQAWQALITQRWIPMINEQRHALGESIEDWGRELRRGAQTTLVGCTIAPAQDMLLAVRVCAIGDALFLLFRPHASEQWTLVSSYPLNDPDAFTHMPDTLATIVRPDLLELAWERRKVETFMAQRGDLLVLASDTLARWLLIQAQQHSPRLISLLTGASQAEFSRIVREELHEKRIEEDDDMTMLVIPL